MSESKDQILDRAKKLIDRVEENRDIIDKADAAYDAKRHKVCWNCRYKNDNKYRCDQPIVVAISLNIPKGPERNIITECDFQRSKYPYAEESHRDEYRLCGSEGHLFEAVTQLPWWRRFLRFFSWSRLCSVNTIEELEQQIEKEIDHASNTKGNAGTAERQRLANLNRFLESVRES